MEGAKLTIELQLRVPNGFFAARFADMLLRQGPLAVRGTFETMDLSVIDEVLPLRPEDVEAEARAVQKRLEHRRASAAARLARKSGARSSKTAVAAATAATTVADFHGYHRFEHRRADEGGGHVVLDVTDWRASGEDSLAASAQAPPSSDARPQQQPEEPKATQAVSDSRVVVQVEV